MSSLVKRDGEGVRRHCRKNLKMIEGRALSLQRRCTKDLHLIAQDVQFSTTNKNGIIKINKLYNKILFKYLEQSRLRYDSIIFETLKANANLGSIVRLMTAYLGGEAGGVQKACAAGKCCFFKAWIRLGRYSGSTHQREPLPLACRRESMKSETCLGFLIHVGSRNSRGGEGKVLIN